MRGNCANAVGVILALVIAMVGCEQIPTGFDSPEPAARIEAATVAAELEDVEKIPELIALLDSDDPATRLVAILSLERITGARMGYDHAAGPEDREAGVVAWVEWYNANADALEGGTVGVGPDESSATGS